MIWGLLAVAAAMGLWLALRPPRVPDPAFDPVLLEGGVDAYLEAAEARFTDIREGLQKQVVWAGVPGAKTDWVVVYIHGFSASLGEIRPVPERVAEGLGANLVLTRLQGHGRSGAAMGEATFAGWIDDVSEALAIAQAVGRRTLVISTSTGSTLTALTLYGRAAEGVAGTIFVAPNFRLRNRKTGLVTWPGARLWLPLLIGRERGFTPANAAHGHFWTSRYPSVALLPMGKVVRALAARDPGLLKTPALFVFDDRDALVDHARTRELAALWGGPAEVFAVETGPDDDPGYHVIAGDTLSPGMTAPVAAKMIAWAKGLDRAS